MNHLINKEHSIALLKDILRKMKDYKKFKYDKHNLPFDITKSEIDAIENIISFMENPDNDADNIYKIKQDYDKKLKIEIQEHCDHDWIEHWTWCCGGYLKCTKCGKTQDFYERD